MLNQSHGPWCSATTWPTKCSSCRTPIFFFSCRHGCKVLFDELGHPWPIHDCEASWESTLERSVDAEGRIKVRLSPNIVIIRPPDSFSLLDVGQPRNANGNVGDPIVAVEPRRNQEVQLAGILRELLLVVDPARSLGLGHPSVARKRLGVLGVEPMSQITVHAPGEPGDGLESYTAWVSRRLVGRVDKGDAVSAKMTAVLVPPKTYIWHCVNLDRVR